MKRILLITTLAAGLVGAIGANPAAAENDDGPVADFCDETIDGGYYCEFGDGDWILCEPDPANDTVFCYEPGDLDDPNWDGRPVPKAEFSFTS